MERRGRQRGDAVRKFEAVVERWLTALGVCFAVVWLGLLKSGGGPPHSRTLPRDSTIRMNAQRLGALQSSGALTANGMIQKQPTD